MEQLFGGKVARWMTVSFIMLSAFLAVQTINSFKEFGFIGKSDITQNVISVNGKGELFVEPDTAQFSFTVREESLSVKEAQAKAATKSNNAIEFLTANGIDKKDIKTSGYNIYPRYEYRSADSRAVYPNPGERYLAGYEVSQSFEIKIKDIKSESKDLGKILSGVGATGVSDLSGLNFINDKEDELRKSARELAIVDAEQDAKNLARALGVSLVRVVNFSESGHYPSPVFYRGMATMEAKADNGAPTPEITTGENKITSQVTITYEIR